MEEFENLPQIKGLPEDNIKRVVLASGAVLYNGKNAFIPLVEVLLVEVVEKDDQEALSSNIFIGKIGVPQLDSVRFGTVFIGNKRTKQKWTSFKGYKEKIKFSFNFNENDPVNIHFGAKKENGTYYIWKNKFSFDVIQDKNVKARFLNSKLSKLVTNNGVSVLVPSLEVLTGLLVPAEQSIRGKLLMHSMDDIVTEYLEEYSYDSDNNEYVIKYHARSKKESNLAFLAYLAMNDISRSRLSKIYNSIVLGSRYAPKYPVVLPYHPTELFMEADGIWMDNKTFLCLRVEYMDPPKDHKLRERKVIVRKSRNKVDTLDESEGKKQTQAYDINDLGVTPENNPSTKEPRIHIGSEVKVGSIKDIISIDVDIKYEDEEQEVHDNQGLDENPPSEKEGPENLSSGDSDNTRDSQKTGKLDQKETLIDDHQSCVDKSDTFTKVIKSLDILKNDKDSSLIDYFYITSKGKRSDTLKLCSFLYKETRYAKIGTKWSYSIYNKKKKIFKPRAALIIEMILKDGKNAYILEIEQKTEGEKFSGLLFNTPSGALLQSDIKNLLVEIAELKGVIRTKNEGLHAVDLKSVINSVPYTHYKDKSTKLYVGLFNKFMVDETYNYIYHC